MDPEDVDALRMAVTRLSRRLRHEGSGPGTLSATGVAVLGRLHRDGAQKLQVLADAEHVRAPSMSRIVDRLAELGMVAREPHPDDRRAVLVRLTEEGRSFVADTVRQRSVWLADRLAQLDDSDVVLIRAAVPALRRLGDLP